MQFAEDKQRASLVFNVAAVAIEAYLIALCARHKLLPFNHDYASLVASAEEAIDFAPDLRQAILSLDEIFGICSIDNYHHGKPVQADAERALVICESLLRMFDLPESDDEQPLRVGQA
jgi:hypothetical protein